MFYIFQFIDGASFMASSLSRLVNNFSEGVRKINCKYGHDDKNVKLNVSIATAFLNKQILKII